MLIPTSLFSFWFNWPLLPGTVEISIGLWKLIICQSWNIPGDWYFQFSSGFCSIFSVYLFTRIHTLIFLYWFRNGENITFTINKETEHRNLIFQPANVVVRCSSFCIFASVPIISICNGGPISIDGEWCPLNYRTLKDIVPFCQTDLYRLPGLRLFHIGVKLLLGSHGVAHRSRTAKDAA